ncbi:MAG TPA: hypothetical protein VF290_02695 [Pyrinomonadaceae bacterium]
MSAAVTRDVISELQTLIAPTAAKFDVVPEHWIHGWDEGLSFCFECAEKKVAELLAAEPDGDYLVDGGWGSEGDSEAFCETCSRALDNSFTDYAAATALDYFEENGVDTNEPSDCRVLLECTYALGCGNEELNHRLGKLALSIVENAA